MKYIKYSFDDWEFHKRQENTSFAEEVFKIHDLALKFHKLHQPVTPVREKRWSELLYLLLETQQLFPDADPAQEALLVNLCYRLLADYIKTVESVHDTRNAKKAEKKWMTEVRRRPEWDDKPDQWIQDRLTNMNINCPDISGINRWRNKLVR